ncbi:MAG TPA: hypothetical protein PK760_06435 [Flavobacteriales bacterium]|nr:hypothetical protein [Flavobacteriales bacterium]
MSRLLLQALLVCSVACFTACGPPSSDDLCKTSFEPYTDLVSGGLRSSRHAQFMQAMAAYNKGDYAQAEAQFTSYLQGRTADHTAYLYLACSQLAQGKPYDAELSIDHLENSNMDGFKDQCEWYTVLCWLCSGQNDRALDGAKAIAEAAHHTYKSEAQRIVDALATK